MLRQSSINLYESHWQKFVAFRQWKGINVFNVRSQLFYQYLVELFEDNTAPSTMISHGISVGSVLKHWKYDPVHRSACQGTTWNAVIWTSGSSHDAAMGFTSHVVCLDVSAVCAGWVQTNRCTHWSQVVNAQDLFSGGRWWQVDLDHSFMLRVWLPHTSLLAGVMGTARPPWVCCWNWDSWWRTSFGVRFPNGRLFSASLPSAQMTVNICCVMCDNCSCISRVRQSWMGGVVSPFSCIGTAPCGTSLKSHIP